MLKDNGDEDAEKEVKHNRKKEDSEVSGAGTSRKWKEELSVRSS